MDWTNDQGSVDDFAQRYSAAKFFGTALRLLLILILVMTNFSFSTKRAKLALSTWLPIMLLSQALWTTKDATQKGQDGERVCILGDFAMEIRQSKTHMGRLL